MVSQYQGQTQHLGLHQNIVITPQLQQAIKLLQMNRMELSEVLQDELLENFCLEQEESDYEDNENENEQTTEHEEMLEELSTVEQQTEEAVPEGFEDIDWEAYFQDMDLQTTNTPFFREHYDSDMPSFEARLKDEETLQEHLLQQISLLRLESDVREMCVYLIGNLNEDGWLVSEEKQQSDPLHSAAEQIAQQERNLRDEKEFFGESLEESIEYWYEIAEEALAAIQSLEPTGVGARHVQEGLLLQIEQLEDSPRKHLLRRLVQEHLPSLERRNYAAIAKKMPVSLQALLEATEQLSMLDPRPGRLFQDEPATTVRPDIYVRKIKGKYFISLDDDGLPKLRINQIYKQVIKDKA
ncbi:MAG: hypothetical protein AAGJ35_05235, partial [Myxococcota bacterium]